MKRLAINANGNTITCLYNQRPESALEEKFGNSWLFQGHPSREREDITFSPSVN